MQKETISYFCDVCKKEVNKQDINLRQKMPVIFTTDQTEGRSCKPYLSNEQLDLCQPCLLKAIKAIKLRGSGAQGYNKYYFED